MFRMTGGEKMGGGRRIAAGILCILLSSISAALPAGAQNSDLALPKIRIAAEGGTAELIRPEIRKLAEEMPEHQMVLSSSADALDAPPVLAVSTRKIPGAEPVPLALKGAVLAVNVKNPVAGLSSGEVLRIMKNQFPQWPGTDVPVRNIYQLAGALRAKGKPEKKKGKTHFVELASIRLATELVKNDVTAIAILPLSFATEGSKEIKMLPVEGVAPDFEPVLSGKYPLVRKYYLSVAGDAPEAVRRLGERLQSARFREQLLRKGFIPIRKDGFR